MGVGRKKTDGRTLPWRFVCRQVAVETGKETEIDFSDQSIPSFFTHPSTVLILIPTPPFPLSHSFLPPNHAARKPQATLDPWRRPLLSGLRTSPFRIRLRKALQAREGNRGQTHLGSHRRRN